MLVSVWLYFAFDENKIVKINTSFFDELLEVAGINTGIYIADLI